MSNSTPSLSVISILDHLVVGSSLFTVRVDQVVVFEGLPDAGSAGGGELRNVVPEIRIATPERVADGGRHVADVEQILDCNKVIL